MVLAGTQITTPSRPRRSESYQSAALAPRFFEPGQAAIGPFFEEAGFSSIELPKQHATFLASSRLLLLTRPGTFKVVLANVLVYSDI